MSSNPTSGSLARSRVFFLGIVGVLVLLVLILNRDALWSHPALTPQEALRSQVVPENTKVRDVTFAIFDTETTGVDPAIDRIVELAVVKFRNGEVVDDRTWLINPERFIPEEAENVHGISAEMVADQPTFAEIYPAYLAFVEGCVLMAHNASFDVKFMKSEIERAGQPLPGHVVVDSLRVFRSWFPGESSYSLQQLATSLGIKEEGAFHRAKDDSAYVGRILYQGAASRDEALSVGELFDAAGDLYRI